MLTKNLFRKPKILLEGADRAAAQERETVCPGCRAKLSERTLEENLRVCPKCGQHFRISARTRILRIADGESFSEADPDLVGKNPLKFPGYEEKLSIARSASGEKEAVLTGTCTLGGVPVAIFAMEPEFMMGSMGTAVGEKITRLFETALAQSLPVIGFTVSGGARVQEGMFSLMQMAKTSGAVKRHSDAGNLFVAVLTDPTTGGVVASFAMEADIILAEPRARIGFAGPRVIEQTLRQKLPPNFQRAEFQLEKGFVDAIVDRRDQKEPLVMLLRLHGREAKK